MNGKSAHQHLGPVFWQRNSLPQEHRFSWPAGCVGRFWSPLLLCMLEYPVVTYQCIQHNRAFGFLGVVQLKTPVVMSWSGGKDSAMALYELTRNPEIQVEALLTTVSEEYKRISHHGVRETLLQDQADAIGIRLDKVYLPSNNSHPCTNQVYEDIMGQAMRSYQEQGINTVGFGDLFLEDLRAWREKNLSTIGMKGIFPIWKRDTTALARQIIDLGFKAYLSCVEGKLGQGFVGRPYDLNLLKDLPVGIDPCGEYGEFHSYVYDGPIFRRPVDVRVGRIVMRDGRYYADLLPANSPELQEQVVSMPPVV